MEFFIIVCFYCSVPKIDDISELFRHVYILCWFSSLLLHINSFSLARFEEKEEAIEEDIGGLRVNIYGNQEIFIDWPFK